MKYYVVKSTKTTEGDLRTPVITAYATKDLAEQAYFTACVEKTGSSEEMTVDEMATAVANIPTSGETYEDVSGVSF